MALPNNYTSGLISNNLFFSGVAKRTTALRLHAGATGPARVGRQPVLCVVAEILAQRLCRKSLGLTLRRPVEEGDKLINDGAPIRLRSDLGGDEELGPDAQRRVDSEGGFEFGGSIDHGVSYGECGAYWGIIALRA